MNEINLSEIENLAKKIRISTIEAGSRTGKNAPHFGGALSSVEILACLYGGIMDINAKNLDKPHDIFILSKGHVVLALYAALAHKNFFPLEKLETFETNESDLSGHLAINPEIGIEFSGGSLGMGISQGIGVCLGWRKKNILQKVFVMVGDGELDEGSNWEAAMSAAHFKLDNFMVIVDKNKILLDGTTDEVMNLGDVAKKFSAFGFEVREVDGHNISEICKNISEMLANKNSQPKTLIAHTVKGKGVSFMENKVEWHHAALNQKFYEQAMQELVSGR